MLFKRVTGSKLYPFSPVQSRRQRLSTLMRFQQKVSIELTKHNFTVKTVRTRKEFLQAMTLRYEVFHREFAGKSFPIGLDTNPFDDHADLLVIIDNDTGKVVGTYRLISSLISEKFYSSTEFKLAPFLKQPGIKLELSRACVQKGYRNGSVIHLLWRGLAEYMKAINASYLFGCSSIQTTQLSQLESIYRYFNKQKVLLNEFDIKPLEDFRVPGFSDWYRQLPQKEKSSEPQLTVPPLLKSYIRTGAKLSPEPAIDRDFKCIDFFTVLHLEQITKNYEKKYVGG